MIQLKIEDYTLQDERIMKMWAVEQAVKCLKMLSPNSSDVGKFADKILAYVNQKNITQVTLDNGEKFDVRTDNS